MVMRWHWKWGIYLVSFAHVISVNFIKNIFVPLLLLTKTSKHALVLDSLISSILHSKDPNAVKKGVLSVLDSYASIRLFSQILQ